MEKQIYYKNMWNIFKQNRNFSFILNEGIIVY